MKMRETTLLNDHHHHRVPHELAPHVLTIPHPPPLDHDQLQDQAMEAMPTSFPYEDNVKNNASTLLWAGMKDQSFNLPMNFVHTSSSDNTASISSPFNSLGYGFMEDNCTWGGNSMETHATMEANKKEIISSQATQDHIDEQAKMFSKDDCTNPNGRLTTDQGGDKMQEMETSTSNFDLEFMESALLPSYCNVSSMDHLSWDC